MINQKKIEKAIKEILVAIGENPNRQGIKDTPKRVAKMYAELFAGLHKDPGKEISIFHNEEHEEMIMVKNIPFYSMCEHHLVPFIGKAHVAYIPTTGRVTGLSKLVRVIEAFAKRPQVQERLTNQIAKELQTVLGTEDVAVIIDAKHLCVSSRGIKDDTSSTTTCFYGGAFNDPDKVAELQNYIANNS